LRGVIATEAGSNVARASRLRVTAPSRCQCADAIFYQNNRGGTPPTLAAETAALHLDASALTLAFNPLTRVL